VTHARSPLALYRALLDAVEGADEDERARAVRRALRAEPASRPPRLRAVVADAGVGEGFLTRGVLSIRGFAPDVRTAMELGLPLATARIVNGIDGAAARARVLAPLVALPEAERRLLPRGLTARIERAARAERVRPVDAAPSRMAPPRPDGWLPPDPHPVAPRPLSCDVWTYPALSASARGVEPLHERVVEALLARLLPQGGDLVDVTAGAGTIGRVAQRHGVASWSGDLAPTAEHVLPIDARRLLGERHAGLSRGVADLLVVHPPTYPVWAEAADPDGMGGLDAYADEVGAMVTGSLPTVRPGGAVVLITRPVREAGRVWLTTSHLAQALLDAGLRLEGYVVAVAEGGGEDWHLLWGRAGVPTA
jgi:hypothetical protein